MKTLGRVYELTKRNILLFLTNKATVFFSFLAPVLIFVLYTVFMNDMLVLSVLESVPAGVTVGEGVVKGVTAAWMIAGAICIATFTIGLNSTLVMVFDKEKKTLDDFDASPVPPVLLLLCYFLASLIITFTLCFLVMCLGFAYLVFFTELMVGFTEFLLLTLILLLSCVSSVLFMLAVMSFFKSNSASAAFTGIFTALIGFFIGAYLPGGMLPEGLRYAANLMPGSHTSALLRSVLIEKTFTAAAADIPAEILENLSQFFSFDLDLFGVQISAPFMCGYIAVSAVLFGGLFVLINFLLKHKK